MSEHIATIKHLYASPTGTNTVDATPKGCNGSLDPKLYTNIMDIKGNVVPVSNGFLNRTFGDGNVPFSLPKDSNCQHDNSPYMCVFCEKWYGIKKPTTESSAPDCSEKTDFSSSPLLSLNGTSGMYSALRPQSPSTLFETSLSETKSSGLHNRLSRTVSFAQ